MAKSKGFFADRDTIQIGRLDGFDLKKLAADSQIKILICESAAFI